ncbi:HNH endonuclease family protein [Nitrosomonas supralitoralis]|uniref:HNH endonuclease n=1 Tax=Nitrosomonas supralitoralis TaxID=2116706 RepID=A0A2P7NW82_9PROT|nr:HNH endonuclease family protein [Nitrosomonas supralitoralis]PSJ17708.1 HNH endonuclease [Nitrosomonas supralitoralis]
MKQTNKKTISIIFLIAALITLSSCALEKRDFPVTRQPVTSYPDHAAPSTPYNRKDWPHWIDADGDCQNTRQELLIATSKKPVQFKDSKECTVIYGEWYGAYTGKTYTKATDVDIDHIVPLAHAHKNGAENWTKAQRRTFANDFENLLTVSNSANRSKSDKAPHEWLPPLKSFWCEYGKRWKHIKDKYRLRYTRDESVTLSALANTCS